MQRSSSILIGLTLVIILVSNTGAIFPASSINRINAIAETKTSKIKIVASFFPIYEFVKAVGGDRIDASVLIPIGAEPHDFDPTIQQIQNVQTADVLVYNGAGMEANWINKTSPKFSVDSGKGINLLAGNDPAIHAPADPHIWLDPILAIHQVENIRDGLVKVDPKNAAYYNQNAQKFIAQLKSLDA